MNGDTPKPADDQRQPDSGSWQYTPNSVPATSASTPAPISTMPAASSPGRKSDVPQDVIWTASEFVAHNKNLNWYGLLVLGSVGLAAIIWFLTKDIISVIVVVVVASLLGVAAKRKPRVLEYNLDHEGVEIGGKLYVFGEFRSFSVMEEGAFSSIMLIPLKRFAPPISIYYAPDDEEKIIAIISSHLPLEERQHDMIDRFTRQIRF